MLKYDNNTVGKVNEGTTPILKAYKGGVMCFNNGLEGGTSTPSQVPCFWVTSDITHYEGSFEDVYDQTSEKWYKLNNLGEYEEYGIYGDTRNTTTYIGKLVIENGYEYEWDGTQWDNLGETQDNRKIIKSPEYIERNGSYKGSIDLGLPFKVNTRIRIKHQQTERSGGAILLEKNSPSDNDDWRFFWYLNNFMYDFGSTRIQTNISYTSLYEWEVGNYYVKNLSNGSNVVSGTPKASFDNRNDLSLYDGVSSDYGKIWYIEIYEGDTLVKDFIPWTDMNGNYGLYDKVNDAVHYSNGNLTASTTINDVQVGIIECPKYYDEKSAPQDNVSFASFAEARSYECPWVLQKATIKKPTNQYYFNYQYEWVKGAEPTEPLTKWVETGDEICYEGYLYDDSEEKYESYDNATWLPTGNLRPIGEAGESCGLPDNYIIQFADSTVKTLCVNNWGGNVYSGELTYGEAKAVTSLGNVFKNNTTITSFNELAFFGGLTAITNGEFVGCTNLVDIVIPSNVATLGFCQNTRNTFSGCSNLSGLTILSGDGTEPLLVSGNFSNGSYWMNNSHSTTPWVFPNRILTFEGCVFGYADYCTTGYFQSATPPVGLASADIANYRKLATIYCPIGASAAYTAALNGLTKTVIEYDFTTDANGVLTKEKYWTNKLING